MTKFQKILIGSAIALIATTGLLIIKTKKASAAYQAVGQPKFFSAQLALIANMPVHTTQDANRQALVEEKAKSDLDALANQKSALAGFGRWFGSKPSLRDIAATQSYLRGQTELTHQRLLYYKLSDDFQAGRTTHTQALNTLLVDFIPNLNRFAQSEDAHLASQLNHQVQAHLAILIGAVSFLNQTIVDHDLQLLCTQYFSIRNQSHDEMGADRGLAFLRLHFAQHLEAARKRHQALAGIGANSDPYFGKELDAFESTYLILEAEAKSTMLERDSRLLTQTFRSSSRYAKMINMRMEAKYRDRFRSRVSDRMPASVQSPMIKDLKRQTANLEAAYIFHLAKLLELNRLGDKRRWATELGDLQKLNRSPLRLSIAKELADMQRSLASNKKISSYR